jgi:hypothetical protein
MSRKKKPKTPTPLPDSPEFQSFVGSRRQIKAVPESGVDGGLEVEDTSHQPAYAGEGETAQPPGNTAAILEAYAETHETHLTPQERDFGQYLEDLERRVLAGELTGEDPFPEDCVDMSHIDDEAGQTEDDDP